MPEDKDLGGGRKLVYEKDEEGNYTGRTHIVEAEDNPDVQGQAVEQMVQDVARLPEIAQGQAVAPEPSNGLASVEQRGAQFQQEHGQLQQFTGEVGTAAVAELLTGGGATGVLIGTALVSMGYLGGGKSERESAADKTGMLVDAGTEAMFDKMRRNLTWRQALKVPGPKGMAARFATTLGEVVFATAGNAAVQGVVLDGETALELSTLTSHVVPGILVGAGGHFRMSSNLASDTIVAAVANRRAYLPTNFSPETPERTGLKFFKWLRSAGVDELPKEGKVTEMVSEFVDGHLFPESARHEWMGKKLAAKFKGISKVIGDPAPKTLPRPFLTEAGVEFKEALSKMKPRQFNDIVSDLTLSTPEATASFQRAAKGEYFRQQVIAKAIKKHVSEGVLEGVKGARKIDPNSEALELLSGNAFTEAFKDFEKAGGLEIYTPDQRSALRGLRSLVVNVSPELKAGEAGAKQSSERIFSFLSHRLVFRFLGGAAAGGAMAAGGAGAGQAALGVVAGGYVAPGIVSLMEGFLNNPTAAKVFVEAANTNSPALLGTAWRQMVDSLEDQNRFEMSQYGPGTSSSMDAIRDQLARQGTAAL